MSTSTYYLTFDTQECNICYETEQSFFIKTRCGHEMCTDCYELLQSNNCPFCRQKLENIPPQHNRFIWLEEPNPNETININRFHSLTGVDRFTYRILYNEIPEFDNDIELVRPIEIVNFHSTFVNN